MENEKLKRKQSSQHFLYPLLFLVLLFSCLVLCGIGVKFPIGCIWDESEQPEPIPVPSHSILVSNGPVVRHSSTNTITREYYVNDSSVADLVSFFENEVESQCQLYTGNTPDSSYAHCKGASNEFGEYEVYIETRNSDRQQQTIIYHTTWETCRFHLRYSRIYMD